MARCTTSVSLFVGPFSTASGYDSHSPLWRVLCWATWGHGGYAGSHVREAENPGPASHDRDRTAAEQRRSARTPRRAEFRACASQIVLQHQQLCQPRHRQQRGTQEDRHDRNSSVVRSANPILPLTWQPLIEVSCSTWVKNTESVEELRRLDRATCVASGTIRYQITTMQPM